MFSQQDEKQQNISLILKNVFILFQACTAPLSAPACELSLGPVCTQGGPRDRGWPAVRSAPVQASTRFAGQFITLKNLLPGCGKSPHPLQSRDDAVTDVLAQEADKPLRDFWH